MVKPRNPDLTEPDDVLELGELPALPVDFTPQRTAPMPLDQAEGPTYIDADGTVWYGATPAEDGRFIGAIVLAFAALAALVSCVFGGRS